MVSNQWPPLSAAVLAGGQSTRMGTDKAMLPLAAGGPPLLAIVIEALSRVADDLLVVGGERADAAEHGARAIPDLIPGVAALGGIYSALAQSRNEHCLIVACDMPFLSVPLLQRMARETRDYDVLVPELPGVSRQGTSGSVYQTLHAIYGKSCLPAIARRLDAGQYKVVGFFNEVQVKTVPYGIVVAYDPSLQSFFNANSPGAMDEARAIHADRLRLSGNDPRSCS